MLDRKYSKKKDLFGLVTVVTMAGMLVLAGCAAAQEEQEHHHDETAAATEATTADAATSPSALGAYPLAKCVVSGDSLDEMGGPVSYVHEGRQMKFCCENCEGKFIADPAKYLKILDDEIVEQQIGTYPTDTCVVTGEKLGEMGPAVNIVVENRLVRLCCSSCEKKVRENPAVFIGRLDKLAADAQRAGYPMDTCVVSGEKLGEMGDPVEVVFAGRLVRFCCPNCVKTFMNDPQSYLQKLDGGANADATTDSGSADEHHGDGQ